MKAPHVKIAHLVLVTVVLAPAIRAQERAAAGAIETQMSWTALSAKADAAKFAADAVDIRVNQVVACARAGMLYAPEAPGANTQGCLLSKLDPSFTTKLDILNSNINSVNSCAASGGFYNRNTHSCSQIKMPDPAALNVQSHTRTMCVNGGNHTLEAGCPSGQRLLGCGGGPGDQLERGEYWVLMPDFKGNKCIGHAGNPWCNPDNYYGQTIVTAICYAP